jgi:hypothetical protein
MLGSSSGRHVLWPYFKLDFEDNQLWVRDARRSVRVPCEDGLLRVLEAFVRGVTLQEVRSRFEASDEDLTGLLCAGVIEPLSQSPPAVRRSAGVAVVSTMLRPGPALRSFIDYHLRIGVARLYLFFEDSGDEGLAIARSYPQVTAVVTDDRFRQTQQQGILWQRFAPHLAREVMARQCLNAQTAVEQALADGIEWLVHLDADELLWSGRELGQYFASLPADVGQVLCVNYEAVPETFEVGDCFREVTLFKRPVHLCDRRSLRRWLRDSDRRTWFVGYGQGKAAVRVAPGVLANSVHEFAVGRPHPFTVSALDPVILHYARCGFSRYRERYESQARPGERCFSSADTQAVDRRPAGAGVHRIAFDIRAQAAFRQDASRARTIYETEIMLGGPGEMGRLLDLGLCVRELGPRDILSDGRASLGVV